MKNRRRHMTLLEVMIVLIIIGLIGGFGVTAVMHTLDQAKVKTTENAIADIEKAIQMYKATNDKYPESLDVLKNEGHIKKLPKDGWGELLNYMTPGTRGDYEIWSLGADKSAGGTGIDADIYNYDDDDE